MEQYCSVIVVAGGKGLRMGFDIAKQYIEIAGRPILAHTIEKFNHLECIHEIILVVPERDIDYCTEKIKNRFGFHKIKHIVAGGTERQLSVYNGLKYISSLCNIVLIHDGVRPFINEKTIGAVIHTAIEKGAAIPCAAVKDSVKISREGNYIEESADRSSFYLAQTPQGFQKEIIISAYEKALDEGFSGTDDSFYAEKAGVKPAIVQGSYGNIKITTKDDLAYAEYILRSKRCFGENS